MNTKSGYPFKLIYEEVATSDLFPDETHENVAKNIYDLIENTDRGITVGIEGTWGSGKSTVIELLKRKITEKDGKKTLFFLFDAWAHEGDPLRRIFLESLIKQIDPDGTDTKLEKLKKEIASRTKSVEVKTERKASKLGKLLFLSTLVLPVGAAILSAINYSNLVWPWAAGELSANKAFISGMMLSLMPFFALVYWWLFGDKDEKGRVKWDFMESDSVENYVQDITEEGERTSIEFEQYFEDILDYSLGSDSGKKFQKAIIVIDNLDRVAIEHASAIWSTLQTFFQHRSRLRGTGPEWMKCLWFLVPYDREGLSRLWDSAESVENSENKIKPSKSYLSKSFQVVAEVPTPVMSAWYDYCANCVYRSLEKWPEDEKKTIINTYQRYGSKLEISPTPRQIHNFINQVGLLGMRWGGIVSAEAIALYAIARQNYSENELRKHLLGVSLIGDYETTGDNDEVKMEISGMLFGVKKEKGIELLIGPVIRNAMFNGDGEIIEKLIEQHGEAFWIVWNAIKKETRLTDLHTDDYRISATKAIYEGMFKYKARIKHDIENLEQVWRSTIDKWDMVNCDCSDALISMANLSLNHKDYVSWLSNAFEKKIKVFLAGLSNKKNIQKQLKEFAALESFLSKTNAAIKRMQYEEIGTAEWKDLVHYFKEMGESLHCVLPKTGVIRELSVQMLPNQNTTNKEIIELLIFTVVHFPESNEWSDVVAKIITWANSGARELGDANAYELMLRISLLCNSPISSQLAPCIAGNAFWARTNAENLSDLDVIHLLVASTLGKELQETAIVAQAVKDYWGSENLEDDKNAYIVEKLRSLNGFGVIWGLAIDPKNKLAIAVLNKNISNKDIYSNRKALLSLNSYKWINEKYAHVINKVSECNDVEHFLNNISKEPLNYAYGLYVLKLYGNSLARNKVVNIVESLEEDVWDESFSKDSYMLHIAIENDVSLNHKYTNAFLKHFTSSIHKNISTDWQWSNFGKLLDKTLDTDMQLERLAEAYFKSDVDGLVEKAFSALSVRFEKVIGKQDKKDIMNRICYWIDNNNWDRITWFSDLEYKFTDNPIESLTSRLNACANELPSEVDISVVYKLATMFNIKINDGSS